MKILCVDQEVGKLLSSNYYKIPRFQRPYSWDFYNIKEFWDDFNKNLPGNYFIGSMVVYSKGTYKYVIDGQQRLTTITIILAALRDAFKKDLGNLSKGIQALIERPNINYEEEFVIQTESSYPYMQQAIQSYDNETLRKIPGEEEELLKLAYEQIETYIKSEIANLNSPKKIKHRLEKIRDSLLALKIIYVEVDNENDAASIYETLNTRGKDLTSSDLLKNHLANLIKEKNSRNDNLSISWKKIRENIDFIDLADVKFDNFIYHYWLATREYTTEKKIFSKAKVNIKTKSDALDLLSDLLDSSAIYKKIMDPSSQSWSLENSNIKKSLDALLLFRVRQPIPFILSIIKLFFNKKIKKKYVEKALNAVELFHYSFTALTSQRSSGGISNMYAFHARELTHAETDLDRITSINELVKKLKSKLPTQKQFDAAFASLSYTNENTKDKKIIQYTLRKLYEESNPAVKIDPQLMTIEHIEPQSSATIDHSICGSMGNLWLLSATQNNALGDKPVKDKLLSYKKIKMISDDILDKASHWSPSLIEKRTQNLQKIMWELSIKF